MYKTKNFVDLNFFLQQVALLELDSKYQIYTLLHHWKNMLLYLCSWKEKCILPLTVFQL